MAIAPDIPCVIEPARTDLIQTPLEFLYTEHLRQRQAAKVLTLIADGLVSRRAVASLADFVRRDLSTHIREEEDFLFPMLRKYARPEDGIEALLRLLSEEHGQDERALARLLALLDRLARRGGPPASEDGAFLRDFADRLRHHIAIENGLLLPLAQKRLDAPALARLSQSIAAARSTRARRPGGV